MGRLARTLVALLVIGVCSCGAQPGPPSVAVGSSSDPESVLVAHLYAAALRFYGSAAHVQETSDPLIDMDDYAAKIAALATWTV